MTRPIKVAMLTQSYLPLPGGAERQIAALLPLLQAQGVEPHIYTRRWTKDLPAREVMGGAPVTRLPAPGPKPAASAVYTLSGLNELRRLRPDVVHAFELLSPTSTALLARRWLGTPVVAKVLRGGVLGDVYKLRRRFLGPQRLRAFARQVDRFIVISREIDRELAEAGVPPNRRVFIPNGVDAARFAPLTPADREKLRADLHLPPGGPYAIFTGRLSPEKRVEDLLALWPTVRARFPQACLLLVGTGPEQARLQASAPEGSAFLGQVDDVAPYLRAADLFLLPSATEGLSNALLEALAAGLPAVATAVGGAPDVIEHRQSGWLVAPGDLEDLQSAVLCLLGDPGLRERLGDAARSRMLRDYSLASVADRLVALYREVIEQR